MLRAASLFAVGMLCLLLPARLFAGDDSAPHPITFDRQVLDFAPTRPDLTVGIVWFSVLTPEKDWTVKVDEAVKGDFEDRGAEKFLQLKQVGKNRFELPPLTIEPNSEKSGAVCMSIKIWFNEIPNERLFFFVKLEDRYAQLSYCTRDVPEAEHHFSQNRVATLDEFRERLKKPLVLNLTNDRVAWRPGIVVDDQGGVYFHSMIVGRTAFTFGFTHTSGIWKFTPNGVLEQLAIPGPNTEQGWLQDIIRKRPVDQYGTLITAGFNRPVTCDRKENLYFEQIKQENLDSPQYHQVTKIDTKGERHIVAGSVRGHKDGPADQAEFANITALSVGPAGEVFVADAAPDSGSWIRRIAPDGTVTTLAGSSKLGFADGKGSEARFDLTSGLAADQAGNVFAADPLNSRVRKVTADGVVTTVVVGDPSDAQKADSFVQPSGVAVGSSGDLYVLDGGQKLARVRKISADGKLKTLVVVDSKSGKKDATSK